MRSRLVLLTAAVLVLVLAACAPARDSGPAADAPLSELMTTDSTWAACARLVPGDPAGVCVDFGGTVFVADGSPARLVAYAAEGRCQEFSQPDGRPGFRPSDVSIRGFFVYAIDETDRLLLRWDSSGAYRDVLLSFDDLPVGRRVSPYGLDVDMSGRLAITDVENHRVLLYDTYLNADVSFGNYGSFDGQFDTPQGVSFTPRGDVLVADTGNGRLQLFSDAGAHRRTIPPAGADNPLRRPRRAVMADDGTIYVADPAAQRVFVIAPGATAIRALVPDRQTVFRPTDTALGRDGRLYVTDAASKSLRAFKVM
jgi:sugar lactone lactonase YvrE